MADVRKIRPSPGSVNYRMNRYVDVDVRLIYHRLVMPQLKALKLDPSAHLPQRANPGDLGYDLFALERSIIAQGETKALRTGLALEFPEGWGAIIKDRSSVAVKGVTVSAGVIDNGYRGEIKIALYNHSGDDFTVEREMKIAQLIPTPVTDWQVTVVEKLDDTERGEGGFGSSGAYKKKS
ncbi:Deoxyuridine 5'-triphosphate nucleotidohydrolase [hydrothermal vent metagenome]|uniref:dUTP diphosphatase n=1 Tax=hydrothermal vent metagenome TaxID=652676 RepID=A0A3B1BTJ5_9ZZZZ